MVEKLFLSTITALNTQKSQKQMTFCSWEYSKKRYIYPTLGINAHKINHQTYKVPIYKVEATQPSL